MQALGGLHHVTAITGDAQGNLDFYSRVLGMRLVKKTVNQDDVSAYHFFYADGAGSPGTDLTFFDWPHTPPHRPGLPEIAPIALRVAGPAALDWWQERLRAAGVDATLAGERLSFADPEGQRLELVADRGEPGGVPWVDSPVPVEHQVRGLFGVGLASARPQETVDLLIQVMGFRPAAVAAEGTEGGSRRLRFEVGPGGPGAEVVLHLPDRGSWGVQGRGGVHHVAFRVADDDAQLEWRDRLAAAGLQVTPVIDRFYFRSVYFREPGGNLFELATDGPGFAADEPLETMGTRLALPPFLEPRRAEIEAGLRPL